MKIISWNIGKYNGIIGTTLKEDSIKSKLEVLDDLIKSELPDIFCIVEGTTYKTNNQLHELFISNDYFIYFEPEFINKPEYKGLFEFNTYDSYGLKLYVKNTIKDKIEPFDPYRAIHKGRLINIELLNQKGVFIFLHRNMSRPDKERDEFISAIFDWCYKGKLGMIADNIFIMGDFNLHPCSKKYFSTESGYLITEVVESIYKVKKRNSLCFYNPIINNISNHQKTNMGGTFYSNNYGWGIYDFVLIRDYDKNKQDFEIITSSNNFKILDEKDETKTKDFFNHEFDHLPIKLNIEL